jgi:hypothetical protein
MSADRHANAGDPMAADRLRRRIRLWLAFFVTALVASGLTAFPLVTETRWLVAILRAAGSLVPAALLVWVERVHLALVDASQRYPFLAYGTDWLAFAHIVIGLAFWGAWKDPVRNVWIVEWAMWCCLGVIPLALLCGAIRGIPFGWRLIDISFGVFGLVPLTIVRRQIHTLERLVG